MFQCENSLGLNDTSMYIDLAGDACVSECLFNKTNININGHINKDILQAKLMEKIRNNWWRSMLPEFVDYCITSSEQQKQELPKENSTLKRQCRPNSLFIIDCIYLKLFGNCPEEIWRDSKKYFMLTII